jgi:hypothetical protein
MKRILKRAGDDRRGRFERISGQNAL